MSQPPNLREHLLELSRAVVDGAANGGGPLRPGLEARRLLGGNPGAPLSSEELAKAIVAYAVTRGVALELGEPE
jgi:hypothetical protein